jgi:hypothetical protein
MDLPFTPVVGEQKNARKLLIFSQTKVGKTTALSMLPNNLIIDLEDGSDFVGGLRINVRKEAALQGKKPLDIIVDISNSIKKENEKQGKHVYDYISLDTSTALEEEARKYAVELYKRTLMGNKFTGTDVVTELPNGAGYNFLRNAFDKIYSLFEGLPGICLILSCHIKMTAISKEGKDFQANDILLTGKLKSQVCADADAIGYMYRDKENPLKTMISFKTNELDLVSGARPEHLKQKEFTLLEYNPNTKEMKANWEEIFLK